MNIQQIYDYAKLATLSYVDLSEHSKSDLTANTNIIVDEGASTENPGDTERIPTALGTQMLNPGGSLPDGTVVTADITGKWTVLDPYFKADPTTTGHSDPASGFAAMLVQNDTTGNKVLAIAGTEPSGPGQTLQDLIQADAQQIGLWGIALAQVVSLYNYVQVLRGTGQVDQLVLRTGDVPPAGVQSLQVPGNPEGGATALYLWIEKTTPTDGLGKIGPNEQLTVTGHSLGGHLSALAVALFPDLFTSAVTFNAPGYNPPTSLGVLGADNLLGLFRQFGADPLPVAGISNRVSTYESEDVSTGDDWEFVAGNVTGTPFSQEQYITVERNTHDVGHLMDGLSISALLAQLDTSFDLAKATSFLKASSAESLNSYEELLRAVGHVITGSQMEGVENTGPTTGDLLAAGGGDFAARSTYYNALIGLANNPAFQTLTGKVTVGLATSELSTRARNDFASLVSLLSLSPIVLKATSGNEADVEATLGSAWQNEHTAWQTDNERIALEQAAGHGKPSDLNYSDLYLADRAAMLSWLVKGNQENAAGTGQDMNIVTQQAGVKDIWRFTDAQSGRTLDVTPNFPQDLHTVYFGDDTYTFTTGDGWDWIEDSDGVGHIELDGITLGSGEIKWKADNVWQQTDAGTGNTITYSLYDRTENGQTFKVLALQGSDGRYDGFNQVAKNHLEWRCAA